MPDVYGELVGVESYGPHMKLGLKWRWRTSKAWISENPRRSACLIVRGLLKKEKLEKEKKLYATSRVPKQYD